MKPEDASDRPDFRNKRIEMAPSTGIEMFWGIAEEFMQRIFALDPGEYLITDESCLLDFTGLGVKSEDVHRKIEDEYDLDVAEIESGNLLAIFMRIHRHRFGPSS